MTKKRKQYEWLVWWDKEKTTLENINFNVSGILGKFKYLNELDVLYNVKFEDLAASVVSKFTDTGGWRIVNTKKDVKDRCKIKLRIHDSLSRKFEDE